LIDESSRISEITLIQYNGTIVANLFMEIKKLLASVNLAHLF